MPSLSSVWNLEPPASSPAAPPLSPYDIEKHPSSSSTSSYPSHRSSMSWGSGSSLHLGNLRGRGVVKRAGLVVGLLCLGVWAVSSVGSAGGAGGALLEVWGKGSSRGKTGFTYDPSRREIDVSSEPLPLDATTQERLDAWQWSPGGRGPEFEGGREIETGGFYQWNMEQCENVWPNKNKDLIEKAGPTWSSLNRSSIHDIRMDLIDQVRAADLASETKNYGSGRGIVFTAGNADTIQRVIWTLKVMRNVYHSTLPAQIYHFPDERPDPDSPQLVELAELGATMVEADGVKDPTKTKNYHLKAIAIRQSPYREVLFLDSDNIPTRDPGNGIWNILGVKCRNEWEQEAGQMVWDKGRHLDALILSEIMLKNNKFWFMFSDGDKDIFRFAFLALRKRWAVPGRYVGAGALLFDTPSGFCGLTMQQYDHLGQPLFIHYNLLKQVPSGVGRGSSWGRTRQFPLFTDDAHPVPLANTSSSAYLFGPNVTRGLGDVDCDMLADADDEGNARAPASWEVRKRAAVERGGRPFFHGGQFSALCIDIRQDDPRPDSSRAADKLLIDAAKLKLGEGEEFDVKSLNSLGIDWSTSTLEVAHWRDDPLLKDFEAHVYDQGFVPNGKGF